MSTREALSVVETRQGRVRGRVVEGVHTFFGIPFAEPPSGARRLRPPEPVDAWIGVRDALAFGAEPHQLRHPDPRVQALLPDPAVPGDDCLNLNIWSPEPGAARLPVMVWIPGGSFQVVSGAAYDGSRFARDGVVCVTIDYRVGAEGFAYFGDDVANLGLLDQVAALRWVRDNIAAFGGDPDNVTLFGESAGAMSIGLLLSMPLAEGLFRRAITQSGAAHAVIPAPTARRIAQALADKLGVPATRQAVAAVPIERLLAAQAQVQGDLLAHPDPEWWGLDVVASVMPFQPVFDGDVLPSWPIDRLAAGAGGGVDLLVGTNTEDWKLFLVVGGGIDQITEAILTGPVEELGHLSLAAYGLPVEKALAAYRAADPEGKPGDLLAAAQTDWWCRIPAIRLADAHTEGPGATWMYEFAWPSPALGGRPGACHALEIPFVFDTLDKGADQIMGPLLGPAPPQGLADKMHAAWIAFARAGDPGWPRYDLRRRATMRFDTASQVVDDPRRRERTLWEGAR